MKKKISLILTVVCLLTSVACGKEKVEPAMHMEPQISQMKAICELAVMECYYHNVAKLLEEDAEGMLWWKKDKHFWVEYSGVVKLGIDVSLVKMDMEGTEITITIPAAQILSCEVDADTLNKDSYILDDDSAKISAEDEIKVFAKAQEGLEQVAANDTVLLANAQQRAQILLEDYVKNIGNAVGVEYTIKWVYLDSDGNQTDLSVEVTEPESETAIE